MNWSTWVLLVLAVMLLLAVIIPVLLSTKDIGRYRRIRKM